MKQRKKNLKFCSRITLSFSEKMTQKYGHPKNRNWLQSISRDPCDEMTVVRKFTTHKAWSFIGYKIWIQLSSTWGIAQLLHSDSLLMTGKWRSRVQLRPRNPDSLGKNRSNSGQQRKTQVATKVLFIVDLRSKTMKNCNKNRKYEIW